MTNRLVALVPRWTVWAGEPVAVGLPTVDREGALVPLRTPPAPLAADRRCLRAICLLLLTLFLLTMAGRLTSGDGEAMYQTTRALVSHRQLSIDPRPEAAPGRDGRYYGKYGLGQSAVQAPFYTAGHVAAKLFGAVDDRPEHFTTGMANSFVSVALAALFWLVVRDLGCGRGAATVATLVFALGTLVWPYARADFSEPLQATSLLLAFYGILRWRRSAALRWAAVVGFAAGFAVIVKAASTILLLPLGLYFLLALWQRFRPTGDAARPRSFSSLATALGPAWRPAVAAAVPFAACGLFQAALNYYRFGNVTEFGYGAEPATGFTTPVFSGIGYLLFSSGKGLVWFAPPVALGLGLLPLLGRRFPLEALTAGLLFLAELLYYARWWAWHGDWCWGPRYLYVTVPFAMLGWGPLLARWRDRALWLRAVAGLLAGGGVLVSALGVAVDYGAYYSVVAYQLGQGVDVRQARVVPEFSPLFGHAWLAEASAYDAVAGWAAGPHFERTDNPFLYSYPWAAQHPDLIPDAPERAVGFDLWFAALRERTPFLEYWSGLVACWLAFALVPLVRRLWRAVRDEGPTSPARTRVAASDQMVEAVPV